MENAQSILLRQGGKDQLLADFTALSEASTLDGQSKYSQRPTMEWLAKFITAQSGGPHKDVALYELCHLVYGVANLLGEAVLTDFFLSPTKATPANYRYAFNDAPTSSSVELAKGHLRIIYDDKHFDVRFGRMPMLGCLYEFLCSMDDFSYFALFNDLFANLITSPISDASLRTCANALASHLRKYRIANLSTAEADGKFVQVYKFLQNETEENHIIIEDDSVLDFWCLHNKAKDYRGYRTVFDLFSDFTKAFDEAKTLENASRAAPLGLNMEQGEIDVADSDVLNEGQDEWANPFCIFDEDDMQDIRFFKKTSERGPIEALMTYGPDALRLPIAFLRYETFGQVQAGITNDLQVGRGNASIQNRISCENVPPYQERVTQCEQILDHLSALQASSLHVLAQQPSNVVEFPNAATEIAKTAFSKMKRKGFDDAALNDTVNAENFARAADGLVKLSSHLEKYIRLLKKRDLEGQFPKDCDRFKSQFSHLYEEALS